MSDIQQTILEIVKGAKAQGDDPVECVQDYFADKDSYFSRVKVQRIIETAQERAIKTEMEQETR